MSSPRKVPSAGFPFGVFEDPRNPLILVEEGHSVSYAKIINDKRGLLLQYKEAVHAQLLFVWQGKASSDVFEITEENLDKLLNY